MNNFVSLETHELQNIDGGIGIITGSLIVGGIIVVGGGIGWGAAYLVNKK